MRIAAAASELPALCGASAAETGGIAEQIGVLAGALHREDADKQEIRIGCRTNSCGRRTGERFGMRSGETGRFACAEALAAAVRGLRAERAVYFSSDGWKAVFGV